MFTRTFPRWVEAFWARVDRRGPDECWPWTGTRNKNTGHGHVHVGVDGAGYQMKTNAHRVAFALDHGGIEPGQTICHSCDNPPCCNPHHLWLGTQHDNNSDCAAKGRNAHGSRSPHAKLTEDQVVTIREAYAAGETIETLAARYGLKSYVTVFLIVTGKTWKRARGPISVARCPNAARGESVNTAKLTAADVLEIRRVFADGSITKADLGRRYGVDEVTIGAIVRGRTWRHLLPGEAA